MKHTDRLQEIITGLVPGIAGAGQRPGAGRRLGVLKNGMLPHGARVACMGIRRVVPRPYPPWQLCSRGDACGRRYGNRIRAAASTTKLLIVAEDKNADPAGFALAPFFIRRELQARFGTITQIL